MIISNGDTHLFTRDNTKIPTCAVDHVETEQNGCRSRITAFDRDIVIMRIVKWISTETIRLSMVSFDTIFCMYAIRLNRLTAHVVHLFIPL